MKKIIFISLLLLSHLSSYSQLTINSGSKTINVAFNRNIEFMGFCYFLGSSYMGQQYENSEELTQHNIKKTDWYAYDLALYKQYKPFRNSPDLKAAVQFMEKLDGADLFAFLLQLEDFPNTRFHESIDERYLLPFSDNRNSTEARKNASLFIESLNRFYQEVSFDQYFTAHDKHYKSALQQVKSGLPSSGFIPAMENFYQQQFNGYTLLPSLTIPTGMGFGVKLDKANQTTIYNVFGPFGLQKFTDATQPDMGFGDTKRLRELSTHEFGHSFVNPLLAQLPQALITQTQILFEPIQEAMDNQGYPEWKQSLNEHFVRAGEILIARNMGHIKEAEDLQKNYIKERKFIYLPEILEVLNRYNSQKSITYQQALRQAMEKLKSKADN